MTPNSVVFAPYENEGFEVQMYLSEYLFQSIIHSLYYDGVYLTQLPDTGPTALTTTELDVATLGAIRRNGWDLGQPCVTDVNATGETPQL